MALFRGSDLPVFLGGSFLLRAQSIEAVKNRDVEQVYELGRKTPVGTKVKPARYTVTIRFYEVGQGALAAAGVASDLKTYVESDPSGVNVSCAMGGISDGILTGIEYVADVNNSGMGIFTFQGNTWTTTDTVTPAADLTKPGSHELGDLSCNIGSQVQRARVRAQISMAYAFELGSDTPSGVIIDTTEVTAEVECIHDGSCSWVDPGSEQDVIVTFDAFTVTAEDCISYGEPHQGQIRGWVTNRYQYRSTNGNLS